MTRYAPETTPEGKPIESMSQQKEIDRQRRIIRRLDEKTRNLLYELAKVKADREELVSLLRKAFSDMLLTHRDVADKLEDLKRN